MSQFKKVLQLSWPASLSMLNGTVIKFIDGLMVSKVSPEAFSAQFLAGMVAFVPESFILGMLTVVNTYVSKCFGADKKQQAGQYVLSGILIALVSGVLCLPLLFAGKWIFLQFGHEEWQLEAMYFRYMIISIMLTLPIRVIEQFFFGIHKPKIVLIGSILAALVNVSVNYVLIFGKYSMPAMGLEGAAIGSLTAWGSQFILLLGFLLTPVILKEFRVFNFNKLKLKYFRNLIKTGWPAGVQLCNDMLSWSVCLSVLAGRFGQIHRTATTIVMRYLGLSLMPAIGIGVAVTAIVGHCVGKKELHKVRKFVRIALLVACTYMGICGILFGLFRYPMAEFFVGFGGNFLSWQNFSECEQVRVVSIAVNILICASIFQFFNSIAIVNLATLRGLADTKWPMFVSVFSSWLIIGLGGIGIGYCFPKLECLGPWLVASVYMLILGYLTKNRINKIIQKILK